MRLVAELAVIFIGVYAAFALSEYESRKDADARRRQLQDALVREIADITSNTRRVATYLPVQMARFDSAVAAGARPPLQPWTEPVLLHTHMWDVTLQSGALDLFDVPTVFDLSRFYNELNLGFAQIAQLSELSTAILIPNLGRGSAEFYEADGRSLRPKYAWYREGYLRLAERAERITTMGDSLVTLLAPADPAARATQ